MLIYGKIFGHGKPIFKPPLVILSFLKPLNIKKPPRYKHVRFHVYYFR